jgi:IS30 family transposase
MCLTDHVQDQLRQKNEESDLHPENQDKLTEFICILTRATTQQMFLVTPLENSTITWARMTKVFNKQRAEEDHQITQDQGHEAKNTQENTPTILNNLLEIHAPDLVV